jgi:hypothetical protein
MSTRVFDKDVKVKDMNDSAVVLLFRNRIHERTISLRFLGTILKVLRLEVSVFNVYITTQFQTTFTHVRGTVNPLVEVTAWDSKEENSSDFSSHYVQEFVLCAWSCPSFRGPLLTPFTL